MTNQTPSQEKLDKATTHGGGAVEYGLYFEHYTGDLYEYDDTETREEDWQSVIYPYQNLESALAGKALTSRRMYVRNVYVVQRTVSPWEVKENG